jgi:hypothetical protein
MTGMGKFVAKFGFATSVISIADRETLTRGTAPIWSKKQEEPAYWQIQAKPLGVLSCRNPRSLA